MISEFEQRLAGVLGPRLSGAFKNKVQVAPGAGNRPRMLVGVTRAEPLEPDFGSRRHEPVEPGGDDFRRVVRLRCTVGVEVQPSPSGGRTQELQGLDDALFALDAGDLQDGTALDMAGDPGFVIQEMRIVESVSPLADGVGAITLAASGWFWPVGAPAQAGTRIGEVRLREAVLPVDVVPEAPLLVAGGPPVELTVRVATGPLLRLRVEAAPLPRLPFGPLAFLLLDDAGGPGAGSLAGGTAGADGVRLVDLVDGEATITYTPPGQAAVDELAVALDDGEKGRGIEIGRVRLPVRAT